MFIMGQMSAPSVTSCKKPAGQCRRCERHELDPWVRKIPQRRAQQPTPVFLPGESYGFWGAIVHRVAKSQHNCISELLKIELLNSRFKTQSSQIQRFSSPSHCLLQRELAGLMPQSKASTLRITVISYGHLSFLSKHNSSQTSMLYHQQMKIKSQLDTLVFFSKTI